jgi:polyisoprenoid-binding protein YceI
MTETSNAGTPAPGPSNTGRGRKLALWIGGAIVALVVLAVGGTWVYINLIKEDAPAELSFEERDQEAAATTPATDAPTTVAASATTAGDAVTTGAATTTAPAAGGGQSAVDGTWTATPESVLGYRVKERLFGQDTEGVGRTNAITGTLSLAGTSVESGEFTVDMTTVQSDSGNRDNQFRGRIMDTGTHPTSTFTLTRPIELGTIPAEGETITATATGDLTLRGATKPVTFDVQARLNQGNIEVNGSIPIVFADWGIPNPSFGPASTADNGLLEFLLVFSRS